MIGSSLAVELSCPVCSKCEYEERLLERVLRNEFELKNTVNKITETHAKVEDFESDAGGNCETEQRHALTGRNLIS
ncbi:hypothetical protein DPMN_144277 [Dreissena polymorpha]|uniref:Uncharacterized protein n=1 Tax=Dreissena polymorpha TaxID=45954 RepID=A0A9D4GEC5_DREPO|nr:hypothetical protein DPMN_144277 [Dreissena polymorpha]